MPTTDYTTAQLNDLASAERALATAPGELVALAACLRRLDDSGLKAARSARRNVTQAVTQLRLALDHMEADLRSAAAQREPDEPPPW